MSDKPKAATKTELYAALADKTGLNKKQIGSVVDELSNFIKGQIGKKGPGVFQLPGLLKIKRHMKPKQAARKGRNPKTGEEMDIAAKPARIVVKVLALKTLKEMVK
jgi:nucleoid DNA-binding protein